MGWEIYPANSKPIFPSFPSFDQYAVLEASQGGLKPKTSGFLDTNGFESSPLADHHL